MNEKHRAKGVDWDSELDRVLGMRKEGMSFSEIGQEYGVSRKAVSRALARRGIGGQPRVDRGRPSFPDVEWPEMLDWRELLDTWEDVNRQHERMDPFQERFTVDLSKVDGPVALASASDLHLGGGFTNHRAIKQTIELILHTPRLYLGITGDSIEGFLPGIKPAESVEQQAGSVKAQIHALRSLVTELTNAGKLLWMSWGDHDALWFERLIGLNLPKQMIHDRVPYFTGRGLVKLLVGGQEYFILANHKEKGRSRWDDTMPNRQAYERTFPADVVITGHTHRPAYRYFTHYEELRAAGLNIGGDSWLVVNGTFKTGPDPYSIRGWSRGIMGVPTLVFSDSEHDVDCFRSPERALIYMRGLQEC